MLKYNLQLLQVTVSLDSENPNTEAKIQYEGEDPIMVSIARDTLSSCAGMFGHLIGASTTPPDLETAMNSEAMQRFFPELIEGEELLASLDSGIPDDAFS